MALARAIFVWQAAFSVISENTENSEISKL
jgi:hypothetical protein